MPHVHGETTAEVGTDFPQCSVGGSSSHAGKPQGASEREAESTNVEQTHELCCQDLEALLSQGC